jgi:hypothetical protein
MNEAIVVGRPFEELDGGGPERLGFPTVSRLAGASGYAALPTNLGTEYAIPTRSKRHAAEFGGYCILSSDSLFTRPHSGYTSISFLEGILAPLRTRANVSQEGGIRVPEGGAASPAEARALAEGRRPVVLKIQVWLTGRAGLGSPAATPRKRSQAAAMLGMKVGNYRRPPSRRALASGNTAGPSSMTRPRSPRFQRGRRDRNRETPAPLKIVAPDRRRRGTREQARPRRATGSPGRSPRYRTPGPALQSRLP